MCATDTFTRAELRSPRYVCDPPRVVRWLGVACCIGLAVLGCRDRQPSSRSNKRSAPKPKSPRAKPKERCNPALALATCSADADGFDCRWARFLALDDPLDQLEVALGRRPATVDDGLRGLFPELGERPIADGAPPRPSAVQVELSHFDPVTAAFPIDWTADPNKDKTWRQQFQSLVWLDRLHGASTTEFSAPAHVVADWVANASNASPPHEFGWLGAAPRLAAVTRFIDAYIARSPTVHRDVLVASANAVTSHVLALAADSCYEFHHNHGAMQDSAVLRATARFPRLAAAGTAAKRAESRLMHEQVEPSITSDGVHVENSPHYHIFYANLLSQIIADYAETDRRVPPALRDARNRMLPPLVHLFQPNRTFPQFGDTLNIDRQRELKFLVDSVTADSGADTPGLAELAFILSDGASGRAPEQTDAVFTEGGYAAFRTSWSPGAGDITAHFTCARHSKIHYHSDETSIAVYGHGRELIVDSGLHSYNQRNAKTSYQYTPEAHNVLVVDGGTWKSRRESRIVAHRIGSESSWVQGQHENYAVAGVSRITRSFAQVRPDVFWVADSVESDGKRHRFAQLFHLHPDLEIEKATDRAVIARSRSRPGATVVLTAGHEPDAITVRTGGDETPRSWFFPDWGEAVPSTVVRFEVESSAPRLDLSVWIEVVAPDGTPAIGQAGLTVTEAQLRGTLERKQGSLAIEVPRP